MKRAVNLKKLPSKKTALLGIKKLFPNIYRFCKYDINKFVLMFRKDVYPYEQMDCCENLNETLLPRKMSFTVT